MIDFDFGGLKRFFGENYFGAAPRIARVGLCRGSQVCSALRRKAPWSAAAPHHFPSLSQSLRSYWALYALKKNPLALS